MNRAIIIWLLYMLVGGCSIDANVEGKLPGCGSDASCKGNRICVQNVCVDPAPEAEVEPETQITQGAAGELNNANATFAFTSPTHEDATFECNLDGAFFDACTSPITYSTLINGAHVFQVRARNGNLTPDSTPAESKWTVACDDNADPDSGCFGACVYMDFDWQCQNNRTEGSCDTNVWADQFAHGKSCSQIGYTYDCTFDTVWGTFSSYTVDVDGCREVCAPNVEYGHAVCP